MEGIFPGVSVIRTDSRICSNVYAVWAKDGSKKIMLVDAGDGKVSELDGLDVELVLLTHGHFDHAGGVKEGWKVLLHENDFSGDRFVFPPAHAEKYPPEMRLKWRGWEFEIIHTPGHTPGSVSLFGREKGILFSGDTLFAGGILGRTDLGFGSQEEIEKSRDSLLALDYSLLCPGHGPVEKMG